MQGHSALQDHWHIPHALPAERCRTLMDCGIVGEGWDSGRGKGSTFTLRMATTVAGVVAGSIVTDNCFRRPSEEAAGRDRIHLYYAIVSCMRSAPQCSPVSAICSEL